MSLPLIWYVDAEESFFLHICYFLTHNLRLGRICRHPEGSPTKLPFLHVALFFLPRERET